MNHLACLCIWVKAWFHLCHGTLTPHTFPLWPALSCLEFPPPFFQERWGMEVWMVLRRGGKNATHWTKIIALQIADHRKMTDCPSFCKREEDYNSWENTEADMSLQVDPSLLKRLGKFFFLFATKFIFPKDVLLGPFRVFPQALPMKIIRLF